MGYFVEWRADRWKMQHFDAVNFILDTTLADARLLVPAQAMRDALEAAQLLTRRITDPNAPLRSVYIQLKLICGAPVRLPPPRYFGSSPHGYV